jgi:acetolactate synthase-1/2/3 large subunit
MKLSDYVMQRVAQAGVRHVFMVPGGAAMHLNDSLSRSQEVAFVCNLHEHASAVAAEAYGKLTNNLGVAMITSGPGSTNCMTGVLSAYVNSTPVLFLSGQVKRSDLKRDLPVRQLGLQEVDISTVVRPITKYATTITEPETTRYHLEQALHLARSGRPGPVWLDFPLDLQAAQIDPDALEPFAPPSAPKPDLKADIAETIRLLAKAERPLLLAGGGIRLAGAERAFLELIDRLAIPVQTTWVGCDLLADDHPLFAGRPGQFASRGANFTIQNADFLVSIGARWDNGTTAFAPAKFGRAAQRVVVDVDDAELQKLGSAVEHKVCASAEVFIAELLRALPPVQPGRHAKWLAHCKEWMRRYPVVTPELRNHANDTSTYVFVERLGELLGEGDVVVEGSSGVHAEIFFLAFQAKARQRVLADGSNGAMGYGLPAAIGACLAASGARTILVEGDGSLMPNLQELEVIARLKLPIKMLVVNNHGYSSIRASQQRWFQRLVAADSSSGLTLPDISRLGAAFGIETAKIDCEAELDGVLKRVLATPGPILCDINVPKDEDRVPRVSNYQRPDGSMGSKPLEDLFPFLDREEFRANMIVEPLPD